MYQRERQLRPDAEQDWTLVRPHHAQRLFFTESEVRDKFGVWVQCETQVRVKKQNVICWLQCRMVGRNGSLLGFMYNVANTNCFLRSVWLYKEPPGEQPWLQRPWNSSVRPVWVQRALYWTPVPDQCRFFPKWRRLSPGSEHPRLQWQGGVHHGLLWVPQQRHPSGKIFWDVLRMQQLWLSTQQQQVARGMTSMLFSSITTTVQVFKKKKKQPFIQQDLRRPRKVRVWKLHMWRRLDRRRLQLLPGSWFVYGKQPDAVWRQRDLPVRNM